MSLRNSKIAAAVVAFVAGCSSPLLTAARMAEAVKGNVDAKAAIVDSVCEAATIQAVDESATQQEAADRLSAVNATCAQAWDVYNRFAQNWLELDEALQANDTGEVMRLIAEIVKDEREFVEIVSKIAGLYGDGPVN